MENLTGVFAPIKDLLLIDKPLQNKDLLADGKPISLPASKSWPITLPELTFSFGVNAQAEITLFNQAGDPDPDSFLSAAAPGSCPLTFNPASEAYLKYAASVTASASGQATLSSLGFTPNLALTGNAKAIFYKKHSNSQSIGQAFIQDITHFRTIFKFEDIADLPTGDALSWMVNGSVHCNLAVSWSDIFSQSLQSLTEELHVPVTLDLSLTPSLTAAFDVSITDNFIYFVTKQADGRCLMSINKTKSRTVSGTLEATIGVKFANQDEFKSQIDLLYGKIIQSIFGHAIEEINAALQKVKQGVTDVAATTIVCRLLAFFKLQNLPASIDTLSEKLDKLTNEIPANLEKFAKASVSLSFTYQYRRIEENKELLSVTLTANDLKNYHDDLLRFKAGNLLDAMRNAKFPYFLNSYLTEKTLIISRSWGFGLKILDLTVLGQDHNELKKTIITNFAGAQQISLYKTVGYNWQLGKKIGTFMGEWIAAMPAFSKTPAPTLDEFEYSFMLNTTLKDPDMDAKDLREYLDLAVLWGAVRPEDATPLTTKYTNLIDKAALVDTRLEFPKSVLLSLVKAITGNGWNDLNLSYLSRGMGAAMTFLPEYAQRSTPLARADVYAGLWLSFLKDHSQEISDYGANAAAEIGKKNDPDHLSAFEAEPANWTFGDSYAGVIRANPNLREVLQDFIAGTGTLQRKIDSHASWQSFTDLFPDLGGALSTMFALRTIGYFLLLHAADANAIKDIKKTCTITAGTGPNAVVVNLSVI